jgi:hypothetical protein
MMPLNMLKERCVNCSRCRNDAKILIVDNFLTILMIKKQNLQTICHYWFLNFEYGDKVVARFSNIGKVNVDVFAPGKIYATTLNNTTNIYRNFNGRAKRCWSCCYNSFVLPNINSIQVKHILMDSGD